MKRLLCLLAALAVLLPRGHAAEPRCVALTFADGPSGALTERLLDGLAARGVHATFFLCGYRIDLYPELAARIAAEGHETGTHGDTHSYFTFMSRAEVCREMEALGLSFDEEKNKAASRQDAKFSAEGSKVEAWVIPTNEELMIARDTLELIEK